MPRPKKQTPAAEAASPALNLAAAARQPAPTSSKLAIIISLLESPEGVTVATLCEATGWQSHSIRGAMAGALKRKGYKVTASKPADGPRRYRIGDPA